MMTSDSESLASLSGSDEGAEGPVAAYGMCASSKGGSSPLVFADCPCVGKAGPELSDALIFKEKPEFQTLM